ncbi:MAG: hypothetical protein KBC35_00060 [Candidatus Pacebacteria bacterium]|nr:hypothetical protein [Candidatus Paceibacterota bacterium]
MNSKALLIAIAAFAVTATGAQAYGGALLSRAGLSEDQVEAIEEARELRAAGKLTEARNKLVEAGITDGNLRAVHRVANEAREAIREAVEAKDYEAFRVAISDSPLADIITSEDDFEQFCEAHELREAGEWEEANELMEDLGVRTPQARGKGANFIERFTDEQREALRVARQSNDRATIQAIFDEAGYEHHKQHKNW